MHLAQTKSSMMPQGDYDEWTSLLGNQEGQAARVDQMLR